MLEFNKLVASEKKEGSSIEASVRIIDNKVTIIFDFDTSKAKITKKGKEFYINFSGKTSVKVEGSDHAVRIGGNLFIK